MYLMDETRKMSEEHTRRTIINFLQVVVLIYMGFCVCYYGFNVFKLWVFYLLIYVYVFLYMYYCVVNLF